MRSTWRNGRFLLAILALGLALPGLAAGEEPIELLDGSVWKCEIREVRASKLVVETLPERTLVEIPFKLLSPLQQYKARSWRIKPEDLSPADPEVRMQLARWCVEHRGADPRLDEPARSEFRKAIELGGASYRTQMEAFLLQHNILLGENDAWLDAEEWHRQRGDVKDPETGKWYPKEEWEEKKAQEDRELKTKLLIPQPNDYNRISLPVLDANRGVLAGRDKNDRSRKVRFFAHFLLFHEEFKSVQAESVAAVGKDKYLRLAVTDEDCAELYVERKKHEGRVARKLQLMKAGDRVQVFGKVYLTETGYLVLVEDLVCW